MSTTTPSPADIWSSVSRYFSIASRASVLYVSASDAVNSLPTGLSKKWSGQADETEILRRVDIELSDLLNAALAAAEVVPGVSEVEISAALGSEVLSQFENVKSSLSTLINGLKSIQSLLEKWLANSSSAKSLSTSSIKQILAAMFASTALSAAVKGLFENARLAPVLPPSTTSTSTSTTSSSSTSQRVSETPYLLVTQQNTTEADLKKFLGNIRAQTTSFNALKVQLVALKLTDSMAKEFSTNPIVSLAFSEY